MLAPRERHWVFYIIHAASGSSSAWRPQSPGCSCVWPRSPRPQMRGRRRTYQPLTAFPPEGRHGRVHATPSVAPSQRDETGRMPCIVVVHD